MELPFGAKQDIDFMFTKLIVHDIGKSDAFYYKSVFGLVEMNRMEQEITGRDHSCAISLSTASPCI